MDRHSRRDTAVRCPFFRYMEDEQRTVACEGPVDMSLFKVWFARREDYERQVNHWCCGRYDACELYNAIESLYE